MSYTAIVIQANDIRPHPNADRLNILYFNGTQFIVSKNLQVGTAVVVFPADGQLNDNFCKENNLYRDATKNRDKTKTGFFEDTRRVRSQPFRGQKSYGFVAELEMFSYLGKVALNVGDEFDTLKGELICQKYYTPATLRKMNSIQGKKVKNIEYTMKEHIDTEKFSYHPPMIEEPSLVIITEKVHGTSARTSYSKVIHRNLSIKDKLVSFFTGHGLGKEYSKYELVSGTRRTIINNRPDVITPGQQDFYRWEWHNKLAPQLFQGESVYYEIVGYDSVGGTIMDKQELSKIQDKKLISPSWRNPMIYSYGLSEDQNDVYVYRITRMTESGVETELSWFQTEQRCRELGLKTVPVLLKLLLQTTDELKGLVASYMMDQPSNLDSRHLMEGICIRVENTNGINIFKEKNFLFGILEGYLKEKEDYVDNEEVN